jgi:hypothetical protein
MCPAHWAAAESVKLHRSAEFRAVSDRSEALAKGMLIVAERPVPMAENVRERQKATYLAAYKAAGRQAVANARAADRAADDAATQARVLDMADTYVNARKRGLTPKGTTRQETLADRKPRSAKGRHFPHTAAQAWGRPVTTYRNPDIEGAVPTARVFIPVWCGRIINMGCNH